MTEVFVDNTDADTRIDPGPADVVVVLDQELEIIQTLEQGPPGPQGPVGPVGPPGPQGPTGYVPGMQNPATENQNMNGFFIRNLPAAVQPYDAVRLQDLSVFSGPGADTTFPNFRIPKLGAFTVDNSENGSTLAMAGAAQYTVTFGDPTTYDANFLVLIVNQDDSYAKDVVGVTTVERFRLYPHQTAIVYRSGGTWECLRQNRWRPPGGNLPIYYNPDTGNDNNDGLTPGNAYRDGSLAFYNINADVDGRGTAGANTRVLIIQADNTTFHGNFHLAVHGTPGAQGGAAFGFRGGVNSVIDSTSMGGSCFELYFGPYSIDNFKLISNAAGIACANQSIAFVGPGMDFGACQTHIQVGNGGSVILGNDYRISGTPSFAHVVAESGGSFQAYGTINISADLSPSYFAFGGQGSISFHGAINLNGHTVTGTRFFAGNGSVVQGGGVPDDPLYFPGSAPGIIAAGGQYGSTVNITGSTSATNTVTSTTPSTSPTTGALTVAGGLGVAGALNVGSWAGFGGTGQGSGATISLRYHPTDGSGLEISTSSTDVTGAPLVFFNNANVVVGNIGWGASQNSLVAGGNWAFSSPLNVSSAAASTSPTTGALTVAGGLGVAGALNAAGKLTVSLNASPLSTPLPTSVAQFGGPNGSNARLSVEAYGGAPAMDFRAASGTAASPGAVITDQLIGLFTASGHNGSAFPGGASAVIQFKAGGAWTPSSTPSYIVLRTTPVGSITPVDALLIDASGGVVVGAPTGGSKGAGTINATAVYDDNVLLTCMGTQHLKDGKVDLARWDAESPTGRHTLAHEFVAMLESFDPRDPDQYIARMLRDEALPGMPTPVEWKHSAMSLGELHNRLWLAVELLASAFAGAHKKREAA